MTITTGTRLGPYEVVSRLGAGGMGEVWRARDSRLQREVAIKVLPGDVSADAISSQVADGLDRAKPLRVYRLELSSGRMELWREFSVSDIGTGDLEVIPTPDGKSYVYGYKRYFSDLFIAEGLK